MSERADESSAEVDAGGDARAEAIGLLRLLLAPGLGPVRIAALLDRYGTPDRVLGLSVAELSMVRSIGRVTAEKAVPAFADTERLDAELDAMDRLDVTLLMRGRAGYPSALAPLPSAPPLLFVRGRLEDRELAGEAVGIVGSRKSTRYGLEQSSRFAQAFADAGLLVVSGGARGVDTAAHRSAMRGGRTAVVLGCGLARAYPPENADLFDQIVRDGRGVIVSELPMHTAPHADNFPARNRIISGLSKGVLVIEAGERSGALITARLAVEEHGREVIALPGPVDSPTSAGCNRLIRSGGASLVTSPADALDQLAWRVPAPSRPDGEIEVSSEKPSTSTHASSATPALEGDPAVVYAQLNEASAADDLAESTGLPMGAVRVALTRLEILGLVRRAGPLFQRSK